ncbi:MAG: VOC family protein [Dehalococcoidia bacterium]|nr:VOC family protein [Dehalococcoidia bacterium]
MGGRHHERRYRTGRSTDSRRHRRCRPERAEAFYSALLGVKRDSAWEQYLSFKPLPSGLTVYLQRVPDKKTTKTRVHMDLTVPDVLAALARVEALGGGALRDFVEPGGNVAVVADPDGDEFCLVRG